MTAEVESTELSQQQSLLLSKVPPEIRSRIWSFCLGDTAIRYHLAPVCPGKPLGYDDKRINIRLAFSLEDEAGVKDAPEDNLATFWGLLLCCRVM